VSASATSAAGPNAGTVVSKSVSCPGTVLTGGGVQVTTTGGSDGKVALRASYPFPAAGVNGTWTASAVAVANFNPGDTFTVVVYAVCA
jgi:hypothetical protein